ncbi:ubiquitin-conjugating enzyme/RWD-like protein, partial [Dioszegia hungarica]
LAQELAELMSQPPDNISVVPNENNLASWEVTITGPPSPSPYSGGKFKLGVEFGLDYPFKAPQIKFKTKMYHPNIDSDGSICMGMLKTDQWKPSTKMQHGNIVFFALYDLIETPNPDDPLVSSIAEQYRTDRPSFDKKAAEYTRQVRGFSNRASRRTIS